MVATTGIVLGAAGLGAAISVPLGIENRKKPKLEIKATALRARRRRAGRAVLRGRPVATRQVASLKLDAY